MTVFLKLFLFGLALAILSLGPIACLPDAEYKIDGPVTPPDIGDGWEIDTPESVGLDSDVLAEIHSEIVREDRYFGTIGLLFIKQGRLVWETYLRTPADRERHQHIQSATKSVTALALGLARDRGHFPDLDARLEDLLPDIMRDLDPDKGPISIEHLLTMRSGIGFDNDDFSVEMWIDAPSDPLRYILEKPLVAKPGERFYYRDADPQIIGYLIQRAVGESEEELVRREIFEPLGIRDYLWESGPTDGVSMAAHGLHLRPRDLAKIGQLVLDGCRWKGRAIISSEWCSEVARFRVDGDPDDESELPLGYGYYFWIPEVTGRPDVHALWGRGGQFALIVPSLEMVVVQVAFPDTDGLHGSHLAHLIELLEPVIR